MWLFGLLRESNKLNGLCRRLPFATTAFVEFQIHGPRTSREPCPVNAVPVLDAIDLRPGARALLRAILRELNHRSSATGVDGCVCFRNGIVWSYCVGQTALGLRHMPDAELNTLERNDLQVTERSVVEIDYFTVSPKYRIFPVLPSLQNCSEDLGVSRWKALMALRARSTTRLAFSRLASVSICLCAFALLPLPEFVLVTCVEAAEAESPSQENRDSSEEELVCSSARRRLNHRRHSDLSRSYETCDRLDQIASYAGRFPTIVGHQLANGLCAPLLI